MNATKKTVEVWHDETSDDTAWIVDISTEDGGTITKSMHETRRQAIEAGRKLGLKRGLKVIERGRYGETKTIASAQEPR